MFSEQYLAECLAAAFLDGAWGRKTLLSRASKIFGRRARGLVELVRNVLAAYPERPTLGPEGLAQFIRSHACLRQHLRQAEVLRMHWPPPVMEPTAEVIRAWNLPPIASPGQLADWLGLTPPQLDWFADVRHCNRRAPSGPLRHYTYHVIRKRDGRIRLLEAPRPRLKAIQRRILHDLLTRVPPHEAVHGFRPGRSVITYAAPHAGQAMVLRLDLSDFFASVTAARVRALFRRSRFSARGRSFVDRPMHACHAQ